MRTSTRLLLSTALLLLPTLAGAQQFSKLDPRARIAISMLQSGTSAKAARDLGMSVGDTGLLDVFIRGSITKGELEALGVNVRTAMNGLYTADVPVELADLLASDPRILSIRGAVMCTPNLDASVPTTGASVLRGPGPNFTGLNGAGILVGDIDTGLDFDHGDFKDAANQTRCITIWDQTVAAVNPPAPYTYGREWTAAEINGGLCTETDPSSGGGHGTHCMGIIAGDGSQTGGPTPAFTYVGMAPMADIIEIKTDLTDAHILDGAAYFFNKATALGKLAVLNISLGSQFGPHDGTSDFEVGLNSLTGAGKIISQSAGNDRGSNWHAGFTVPAGGDSVKFNVTGTTNLPLGNPSAAIDGYYDAPANYDIYLRSPVATAPIVGPIHMGNINAAYPGTLLTGSANVYVENGAFLTSTGAREVYIEVTRTGSTHPVAGTWTVYFVPVASPGRVDMWKFYSGAGAATFTSKNTNERLVSEPGNAPNSITTAAYVTKQGWIDCGGRSVSYTGSQPFGTIASFSSPGPSRNGAQKPDIAAPGFGVGSARSFDYTINCGTGASALLADLNHIINQGTSMAAPHVAGAAALLMQKYGAMTPAEIKAYLNSHAIVDGQTGSPWNADWGGGKLFLGDLADPTVTVIAENGGETLIIGASAILQWSAADNVGVTNVDLLLSTDGGANYSPIATAIPNTGSYNWTVSGPPSNNCLFKVVAHDANGNAGNDVSDAPWAMIDGATPTQMTLLAAESVEGGIEVRWQFADGSGYGAATLQRSGTLQGPWTAVAGERREDAGVTRVLDRDVTAGQTYWYRVSASRGGSTTTFGPVSGSMGVGATEFALGRVVPTPSTGVMRVDYTLPRASRVDLRVVDVQGRTVSTLLSGMVPAGHYVASWDGMTPGGPAPAGLYFIRMIASGKQLSTRVVLAR